MQPLHNIDKSPFRKGEYVGYADGVWIIKRAAPRQWYARHREFKHAGFYAATLAEVSAILNKVPVGPPPPATAWPSHSAGRVPRIGRFPGQ